MRRGLTRSVFPFLLWLAACQGDLAATLPPVVKATPRRLVLAPVDYPEASYPAPFGHFR